MQRPPTSRRMHFYQGKPKLLASHLQRSFPPVPSTRKHDASRVSPLPPLGWSPPPYHRAQRRRPEWSTAQPGTGGVSAHHTSHLCTTWPGGAGGAIQSTGQDGHGGDAPGYPLRAGGGRGGAPKPLPEQGWFRPAPPHRLAAAAIYQGPPYSPSLCHRHGAQHAKTQGPGTGPHQSGSDETDSHHPPGYQMSRRLPLELLESAHCPSA
mmetsp:Transcript_10250/g.19840  ORF Transcript_10250/g.19840 Transcript_10250/m.19840 type:complete len:208 (-) Transcript_10250:775-1398(-)